MAPPRPTPDQLRSLLVVGAVALAALAGGWWLGRLPPQGGPAPEPPKRAALQREVSQLRLRLERRDASEEDRQRLLELLVGLERRNEAISLLEPMADREPDRWSLRLMLAELRRAAGDRPGAEREVRQILSRHPDQVEALQLMALLQLEQGQGSAATALVTTAYEEASSSEVEPKALGLGLLLAELQLKRGQAAEAQATYLKLARDFRQDPRPLLALSLMLHDQWDSKAALAALQQARQRDPQSGRDQPELDKLAREWGLRPDSRNGNASSPKAPSALSPTSGGPASPSPRTP
jgi:tetratricopeptide (TPR) repeat protein